MPRSLGLLLYDPRVVADGRVKEKKGGRG